MNFKHTIFVFAVLTLWAGQSDAQMFRPGLVPNGFAGRWQTCHIRLAAIEKRRQ